MKMKRMAESGFAKKSKEMKKEIKAVNVLSQVSYALIVVVSVLILSMAFAGIVSADNEAFEATVLPLTSEEKGLIRSELNEKNKSRFAEKGLWVGTGDDILDPNIPIRAKVIAEFYKPKLRNTAYCPDKVYYRVIKGKDSYVGFDAYLIQYFAYWDVQHIPYHEYDFEPIFIYVRNLGDRPYRVAYDRCDFDPIIDRGKHIHEIHRYYSCINPEDGPRDEDTHTNDKAYYPYGRRDYTAKVNLLSIDTSLKNNWDGNHVKLGIAHTWHTFDTDISGKECPDCELEPLTDAELKKAYNLTKLFEPQAFKYDISDPFDGLFWEDHYHLKDLEFPTIYGNITSAVVYDGILNVKVAMSYDNTGAGGSPGQHLTGLWWDRFSAKISTDTDYEDIGDPDYFNLRIPCGLPQGDLVKYIKNFRCCEAASPWRNTLWSCHRDSQGEGIFFY